MGFLSPVNLERSVIFRNEVPTLVNIYSQTLQEKPTTISAVVYSLPTGSRHISLIKFQTPGTTIYHSHKDVEGTPVTAIQKKKQ
jgi:hypothetical protein